MKWQKEILSNPAMKYETTLAELLMVGTIPEERDAELIAAIEEVGTHIHCMDDFDALMRDVVRHNIELAMNWEEEHVIRERLHKLIHQMEARHGCEKKHCTCKND